MWGMIAKMTIAPGKREEMIAILRQSAAGMPGCFSYVVAKDSADENIIWVTEVWKSEARHDASLLLPQVRDAIPQAKPLVCAFERVAVTNPVWGAGSEETLHKRLSEAARRDRDLDLEIANEWSAAERS